MFATYQRDGGVGVVTLDRPDRRNSIGQDMLEDLERAWEEFMHDDDAFAAVLVGNGSTFCAGRDIKGDMAPLQRSNLGDLFVPKTNKPIVVGVQGHVIGLGWYMVSGCDYVVAGDDTSFAMTQLRVGLPGPYGFAPRMNLGPFVAFELLALGRPLLADRARSLGLVNEVVAPAAVRDRAISIAKELLAVPPELLQLTKQLLRGTDRTPSAEVSTQYWEGRAALEGSPNIMEARAAQRERRAPVFTAPTPVS